MKKFIFLVLFISFSIHGFSQGRPINKLTLETTYSYKEISKALRDSIDRADRSSYFDDEFFNSLLKKIVADKQYSDKEKVQLFYLMQKKLGFAFVGVNYLPPKQSYFNFFIGEVLTWQKTRATLKNLNVNPRTLLVLAESERNHDPILCSNAILLATLLNPDSAMAHLRFYSQSDVILLSKSPDIFNHYICLSATIKHDTTVTANLMRNALDFGPEALIEDAICAVYAVNSPVSFIKDYILQETNPENNLSIETAICALSAKVPPAAFEKSMKILINESKEKWKRELCKNILAGTIPYNYSLANKEQVVTKTWDGVTLSIYTDGALMTNGTLLEFDPN